MLNGDYIKEITLSFFLNILLIENDQVLDALLHRKLISLHQCDSEVWIVLFFVFIIDV